MLLSDSQWEKYEAKYGKLMWMIARRISGDVIIAHMEDNYSELCMAALKSINGYFELTNKSFDEMMLETTFDQYTKTCLWACKAKIGVNLSDRLDFRNKHYSSLSSMDNGPENSRDILIDLEDKDSHKPVNCVDIQDFTKSCDPRIKKLLKMVEEDPALVYSDGRLIPGQAAKKLGISNKKMKEFLKFMEHKIYGCN